jgi:hypothetical protein
MAFINFDGDHISNTDLVFLPSVSTFAGPGNGATSAQPMSRAKLFFPNNVRADFFFTKSTTFYFAKEFLPSARVFSLLCQKRNHHQQLHSLHIAFNNNNKKITK